MPSSPTRSPTEALMPGRRRTSIEPIRAGSATPSLPKCTPTESSRLRRRVCVATMTSTMVSSVWTSTSPAERTKTPPPRWRTSKRCTNAARVVPSTEWTILPSSPASSAWRRPHGSTPAVRVQRLLRRTAILSSTPARRAAAHAHRAALALARTAARAVTRAAIRARNAANGRLGAPARLRYARRPVRHARGRRAPARRVRISAVASAGSGNGDPSPQPHAVANPRDDARRSASFQSLTVLRAQRTLEVTS